MQDWTIFCVSMCLYFVELVFRWVFLRGFFPLGFSSVFFPWLVLGSTFLNLYVPPALYCVCCFVLVVIMTFSSGVHRAPYLILADACVQHISCV